MSGYKVVPVEPTRAMIDAAASCVTKPDDLPSIGEGWTMSDLAFRTRYMAAIAAAPAVQGEPVYLYRRLGLNDFVTCDFTRYTELSGKPNFFETKILYAAPQPAPTAVPSRDVIRATLMAHGFTVKIGQSDLKPYVYEAVEALFARPAPAAPEEAVDWATRLYNTAYHAGHHDTVEGGYTHVYPQDMDSYHEDVVQEWLADNPQPSPDVTQLVDALETIKRVAEHPPRDKAILGIAESALAAHRKGGDTP